MSGYQDRIARIQDLLTSKGLDSIVLRRNPNIAWFIGGRAHVPTTIDMACLDLVITHSHAYAVTNVIEGPRLIAEELPSEIEVKMVAWWEGRDPLLPTGPTVGTDQPGGDRIDLGAEIEIIRQSLVDEDIERFRSICADSAHALGEALKEVTTDDREIDVAGKISKSLWIRDLELSFLGVAGERRAPIMRHPLPTHDRVGERVVASICAKRKGLIASVTRIVTFGEAVSTYPLYEALLQVESAMLNATTVGAAFSEPIAAASIAYRRNGFEENEWQKHHQGGPTGYLPRDWPANLGTTRKIELSQPIAWNPTAAGWKVEDTLITTPSGAEILTNDPSWPFITVDGRKRPGLLRM